MSSKEPIILHYVKLRVRDSYGRRKRWRLEIEMQERDKDFLYIHMSVCCLKKEGEKKWSYTILNIQFKTSCKPYRNTLLKDGLNSISLRTQRSNMHTFNMFKYEQTMQSPFNLWSSSVPSLSYEYHQPFI